MAEPITVTIQGLNSPISTVKVQNKLAESAVTSVAGKVGDVLLTQADVAGLENVNNTSDLDKPISTATQAAIDAINFSGDFAPLVHQHILADISGAGTAAAADTGDFATFSHNHFISDISGIGTAATFDSGDFAPYVHTHIMSDVTDLSSGVLSFTNKDLTDYSNIIHADQIHLRVKADTNLLKGQPVKFDSYNIGENAINVSLADQMTSVSIGLAEEDILQGNFGNIITAGILDHVNTTGFNEGEILYVNGEGLLTGVEPLSGYSQPIALCLKSQQNNGALQVLAAYPKQPSTDVRNDSTVSGLNVTEALDNLYSSIGVGLQSGDNVSFLANDAGYLTDAVQSGDNVSLLVNDENYVSSGDNVSLLANDVGYLTDAIQSGNNISLLTNDTGYLTSETNQNWYITKLGDEITDASVGVKTTWMVPASGKIHNVAAGCSTIVSGSAIILDVKSNGSGIFSTKPTIDDLEQTTATAASGSALSTSPTAVAPGDKITFEVDTFGGVGGAGLHIDLLISWD